MRDRGARLHTRLMLDAFRWRQYGVLPHSFNAYRVNIVIRREISSTVISLFYQKSLLLLESFEGLAEGPLGRTHAQSFKATGNVGVWRGNISVVVSDGHVLFKCFE